MNIRRATEADRERWLELRTALLPDVSLQAHDSAIGTVLRGGARRAAFLCKRDASTPAAGLLELRLDGGNGALAHVEILYVTPDARRQGVARALLEAAEAWATRCGCQELRCHWSLESDEAHAGLQALGFTETSREVHYARRLHRAVVLADRGPPEAARPVHIEPPASRARIGARRLAHALTIAAGIASLLMTDIFSGDVVRGALLPLLDVAFIIYLLAMLAGRQYRRRTDSSERGARLFDAAPDDRRETP